MYASTTMFTMPLGMRKKMEQSADRMLVAMSRMNGLVSMTFVRNEETTEHGGIARWESEEDAEAAMRQTGPKLDKALAAAVIGPLNRKPFEVYELQS